MNGIWKKCLGLTAGLLSAAAQAGEPVPQQGQVIARAGGPVIAASSAPARAPSATLERPVPGDNMAAKGGPRRDDPALRQVGFAVTRAQDPASIPLPAASVPVPAITTAPPPGPVVSNGWMPYGTGFTGTGIDPDRFAEGDGVSHAFTNCVYVESEFLLWRMQGTRLPPLVVSGLVSPVLFNGLLTEVALGDRREDVGTQSGHRLRAGWWVDRDHSIGLEGSYFILAGQSSEDTVASTGLPLLAVPFLNAAGGESSILLAGNGLAGAASTRLETSLWGAEFNVRANVARGACSHLDLLAGFRTLDLHDEFTFEAVRSHGTFVQSAVDQFDTRNTFYGGQLGAEYERRQGRWALNVTGKLGLGNTHQVVQIAGASAAGALTAPGGIFTGLSNIGRHSRDKFTLVPEVGVKLGYQVSDHLRANVGYNFLYWSSVARPGEQIDRVLGGGHPAFAFKGSDFWVQGLTAGLEFRY